MSTETKCLEHENVLPAIFARRSVGSPYWANRVPPHMAWHEGA
jgi:hypothetical protein